MPDVKKLLIGGGVTTLLALAIHAIGGEKYAANLDVQAREALSKAGVEGADVHMQREPVLSRTAILHGDLEAHERASAEQAVRSVNGIADARWETADEVSETAASEGADTCQTAIDKALDGRTINFRSGSAYMPDSSVAVAHSVADAMKECGEISLEVAGHSNAGGSEAASQSMSQERAERVMAVMVERGVDPARISAKGYGSAQLKIEGTSAEANLANRRVEFVIEGAKAPAQTDAKPEQEE